MRRPRLCGTGLLPSNTGLRTIFGLVAFLQGPMEPAYAALYAWSRRASSLYQKSGLGKVIGFSFGIICGVVSDPERRFSGHIPLHLTPAGDG